MKIFCLDINVVLGKRFYGVTLLKSVLEVKLTPLNFNIQRNQIENLKFTEKEYVFIFA